MVEAELSKILIDESKPEQIIVLREKGGERILPIVIGINEAFAIRVKLSGFNPPRPLTHDLVVSILSNLEVAVKKVIIDNLEGGTFFAKIIVEDKNRETKVIDARPSDAVAIAVRMGVPIFIEEEVFEKVKTL